MAHFGRATGDVAGGSWAALVVTAEDFGIGVTQLDGNIALEFVLKAHSLHAGHGLDHRRLSVSHMTDGAC